MHPEDLICVLRQAEARTQRQLSGTWATLPLERLHAAAGMTVGLEANDNEAGVACCVPGRVACLGRGLSRQLPTGYMAKCRL